MRLKFEDRPVCSCGVKMKLVEFKGYYENFNYWRCDNCDLDDRMQKMKPDKVDKGAYV